MIAVPQGRLDRVDPSGTTSGPSTVHPASASSLASTGPDRSSYTPAAARLDTVTASARIPPGRPRRPRPCRPPPWPHRYRPGPAGHGRRQVPVLPPVFSSTRTSLITAAGSTALTMSIRASAGHRHRGQRLHLHPGAVRGTHGRLDEHPVVAPPSGPQRPSAARSDGTAGPGPACVRALDPGDPGHRQCVSLGHLPARSAAIAAGDSSTRPVARACRAVTSLPETSTIRACPDSSTCVRPWLRHGSEITSAPSPASIAVTGSGTTISALAWASAPSWCDPWPVSGVTVVPSGASTPRRKDLRPAR